MAGEKFVKYKNGKFSTDPNGGGGGGSSTFSGLDDVEFTNLQDGQVPKYNSSTQKWENGNESGGGGNVDDVEVNGVSVVDAQKVAKIKSYEEVTQAEYNALPDSKLNDGILYAIKDVGGSDGFPPLIYSDEEREVGVWRDGKPLYQKTIYVGSLTRGSSFTNVEHHISNIDKIISTVGMVHYTEGGEWANIPNPIGASSRLAVYSTTQYIRYYNDNVTYTDNAYFTLQYTKTTDTAGAGMWTTQGALAHHYSTTEHIIGTWIDGKPIYENIIDNGIDMGISNSGWQTTGITINNGKMIISCFGISNDNSFQGAIMGYVDNNILFCQTGRNGSSAWVRYFIIRYTKTTD